MILRRRPAPEPAPCACSDRVAELEAAVAALARAAARNGGTVDAYYAGPNRAIDNRRDAAVIRKAAQKERT